MRELELIDELWKDIDDIALEVQEYRDKAMNTAARPTDNERVQAVSDKAKLNVVEKYIQAETERMQGKQEELQSMINWLRGYLDQMNDRAERNVISQRYIMHRHPRAIAESLGYSENHVYKLLRTGEENLSRLARMLKQQETSCNEMEDGVR